MSPLHYFGDLIRQVLLGVPLWAARGLFLILLVLLLVWVLRRPRHEVVERPDRPVRLQENLKLWAAVALMIQLVIYSLL